MLQGREVSSLFRAMSSLLHLCRGTGKSQRSPPHPKYAALAQRVGDKGSPNTSMQGAHSIRANKTPRGRKLSRAHHGVLKE